MLENTDKEIYTLIQQEKKRQQEVLEMIPSENFTSLAVMEALGSVLTNKYSEGYPRKRYYQGNEYVDTIELLAIERAKKLFHVPFVNVQALSGSPANAAVYMAVLKNGEKLMGLALDHGGHLTHGLEKIGFSGRFFTVAHYYLNKETKQIDYDEVEKKVLEEKPQLLICGFTAYSQIVDWARFRKIADKVGAWVMADISHIAGLVVGGVHPSPVDYADIVTTTTHKSLRGPRGALIMVTSRGMEKDPEIGKRINSAVFPGLQGGPHDNQTAAIAIALGEASLPSFTLYAKQIVANAKQLASVCISQGLDIVSGSTQNHLLLLDLQAIKVSGKLAAEALERAGIVVNYNLVPFDPLPPMITSGIRLGTPALTTRGMKEKEMEQIGIWIAKVLEEVKGYQLPLDVEARKEALVHYRSKIKNNHKLTQIAKEVHFLCTKFPLYS